MSLENIKQCLEMMKEYDLRELHIKLEDFELRAHRGESAPPVVVHQTNAAPAAMVAAPATVAQPAAGAPAENAVADSADDTDKLVEITSPIVGTFYRRSSPDSPAFVDAGDVVDPDTVVCLVEAMKVFNEIKAQVSGTIVKAVVEDGSPVEFGQPLFLVRPTM